MNLDESIAPEWDAAALFVAYLYGVWTGAHWISGQSMRTEGSAAGLIGYVIAALLGLAVCAAVLGALAFGLRLYKAPLLRGLALTLALLGVWVGYGWPHWFALLVGVWFSLHTYWQLRKKRQDSVDLANFD